MTIVSIAIGGAIGSVLRYLVQAQSANWLGDEFPYGTMVVNVLGSLLMGFLSIVLVEGFSLPEEIRLAVLVGLLGGFTTFSAFSHETLGLIQQGNLVGAASNVIFSVVLCVIASLIGVTLARTL